MRVWNGGVGGDHPAQFRVVDTPVHVDQATGQVFVAGKASAEPGGTGTAPLAKGIVAAALDGTAGVIGDGGKTAEDVGMPVVGLILAALAFDDAEAELEAFCEKWDTKFPSIGMMWRRHWPNLIAIFDYPPEIRKVIYTTNAIESLNSVIRKSVRKRKLFPSDTAALKVVYLSAMEASKRWKRPVRDWKNALNQFAIQYNGELNLQS